jgi:hypothetical protein
MRRLGGPPADFWRPTLARWRTLTERSILLHNQFGDQFGASWIAHSAILEPLWNLFECSATGADRTKKYQDVKSMIYVVPQEGFEPPTPSLRMMCSTD